MISKFGTALVAVVLATSACGATDPETVPLDGFDDVTYSTPGGQTLEVTHLHEDAVALTEWAFDRFDAAQLPEPTVQWIDFGPQDPQCEDVTGWTRTGGDRAEIHVCLGADRICTDTDGGAFTLAAKLCILHELSHVWLADHTSAPVREEFIALTGAPTWRDPETPWAKRGVEEAADTITWGLLGQTIEILGRPLPTCEILDDGYMILTGRAPTSDCDHGRAEP